MKPKNTICIWYDKEALEAARFYAATFPDSHVTALHKAPSDYTGRQNGDVLHVECTGRPGNAQRQLDVSGRAAHDGGSDSAATIVFASRSGDVPRSSSMNREM